MEINTKPRSRRRVILEPIVCLVALIVVFGLFALKMGLAHMLNTLMNTAYALLIDTAFYIMAIAVVTGALAGLMSEFGVTELLNRLLSPLMKPLFGLPGASALGLVTTYLSDNPAILSLADDETFKSYFKKYQFPALTNLGTAFGMGLIVTSFMIGLPGLSGQRLGLAVLVGNLGAVIGGIVSTRLMLVFTKKEFGTEAPATDRPPCKAGDHPVRDGNVGMRAINAVLDGGRSGVKMGLGIIPGVLVISTLVLMLTNGASDAGYTGAAYEGVGVLPLIAGKLSFILKPLFGFTDPNAIAVPITALGSAGAAIGLVPKLIASGASSAHDIAVFTAMCMCWSGYLSTHVSMMDSLGCTNLTGKAILSHTAGGIAAGVAANWLFIGISALL